MCVNRKVDANFKNWKHCRNRSQIVTAEILLTAIKQRMQMQKWNHHTQAVLYYTSHIYKHEIWANAHKTRESL